MDFEGKRGEDRRNSRMSIRGGLVAFSPILAVLLFMLTVNHGEAIWLTIPPTGGTKCVSEEIQSNVVVLADYYVVYEHILKTHRLFLLRYGSDSAFVEISSVQCRRFRFLISGSDCVNSVLV